MPLSKPQARRHLTKARSNFDLYQTLKAEGRFLDWAITVLFYTAMHLVQAYFVENAVTGFDIPRNHADRDLAVARQLREIYFDYSYLYTRSQWARYQVDRPDPTPAEIQQFEDNHFRPIEGALNTLEIAL